MEIDLKLLKQKIYQDNNIIPILEALECSFIHTEQSGNLICAKLPDKFSSDNKRSIQIKNNESLTSYIRSKGIEGDIYSIIGFCLYETTTFDEVRENLYQIVQWICNELNYDIYGFNTQPKIQQFDYNYFLRPIQKERQQELRLEQLPVNTVLNENILNQYLNYIHIDWFNEGINENTRLEYGIRFDLKSNRIIIPIYNDKGLIGIKGRYVFNLKEEEKSDIPKYLSLYSFYKSIELFNLYKARKYIQQKKQVIILESEKSCIKAWQWGIKNTVSIMGSDISPVQIYLLKQLGLDVELILCLDKDKDTEFIHKQFKNISNRRLKYIFDTDNLLTYIKSSPTDNGEYIFKTLIDNYCYNI